MKARAFSFWLQGYFEINGDDKPLSVQQMCQIRARLDKVDPGFSEGQISAFEAWLRGSLDTVQLLPQIQQEAIAAAVTVEIKQRLNNVFVHAIDPTITGDQNQHRRTHRPEGKPGGGIEAMC